MRLLARFVATCFIVMGAGLAAGSHGHAAAARVRLVHTYGNSSGVEIANLIAIDATKLTALLPAGYQALPAAAVGLGGADQGVLVIANFRGEAPFIDGHWPSRYDQVAIDVVIAVLPPPAAATAGLDISGAFHFHTLTIYSDDARYLASLRTVDMPV
jgi:hypothetical protein